MSHPNDEVAVQVLAFLQAVLFLGNESAQLRIGHLCSSKDTKFFSRLQKLLDIVIASLGHYKFESMKQGQELAVPSEKVNEYNNEYTIALYCMYIYNIIHVHA